MFNVALAISILVASQLPIGQRILLLFTTTEALKSSLGIFGAHLLVLVFKYLLLAFVLYAVFRILGFQRKFNFNASGRWFVLQGNFLILAFGVARACSSTIQGGGVGFVLAQFNAFVFFSAWLIIFVGLVLLLRTHFLEKAKTTNGTNTHS